MIQSFDEYIEEQRKELLSVLKQYPEIKPLQVFGKTMLLAFDRMASRLFDAHSDNLNCPPECHHFYSGEIKHHPHCPFYPNSLSQLCDLMAEELKTLKQKH